MSVTYFYIINFNFKFDICWWSIFRTHQKSKSKFTKNNNLPTYLLSAIQNFHRYKISIIFYTFFTSLNWSIKARRLNLSK